MRTTINQLNRELKAIADSHKQVNSYYWGSLLDSVMTIEVLYPLVNCFYPTGGFNRNTSTLSLYIEVSDKVFKDRSNLKDTESDTLQVCRHFFNVINRSERWNRILRVDSSTFSKFWERSADEVAGHTLVLNVTLFDTDSICDLPLEGYDFEASYETSCAPALVINSDSTYVENVSSGGVLELPDTTLNVFVNEILQESVTFATLSDVEINITN